MEGGKSHQFGRILAEDLGTAAAADQHSVEADPHQRKETPVFSAEQKKGKECVNLEVPGKNAVVLVAQAASQQLRKVPAEGQPLQK